MPKTMLTNAIFIDRPLMKHVVPCLLSVVGALEAEAQAGEKLLSPVQCTLGNDCFVQQYPDMEAGSGVSDPFCGTSTYDGHQGTDFRLRSMKDVENDVPVVAVAAGTILRVRDGEPDHLITNDEERDRLDGKECGNGIVIEHGEGLETQLCHLKRGSISVKPGESVRAGQQVGAVGASGMAQFPHVHLSVRRNEETIDPATGKSLSEGCSRDGSLNGLFTEAVAAHLDGRSFLLDMGLSGSALNYDRLVKEGAPPDATSDDFATVGWAWFGNLHAGDRIRMEVHGPDGGEFSSFLTEPLAKDKATFSHFSGRKRAPLAGTYRVSVKVLRGSEVALTASEEIHVR